MTAPSVVPGRGMELRVIGRSRRFTEIAVTEARSGRDPLRTEVLRNNKEDSYYCRACKSAEPGVACRHILAARRFTMRAHMTVLK